MANGKHQISKWLAGKILRGLPAIAWMGVIFWFSAQPKEVLNFGQSTLVSKLAHVAEYAILGWLIQRAREDQHAGWQAWLMAAIYAATDEFHQSFTPGRHPLATDVLIDSFGAAIGVAMAMWRK
jgi:VanZ family protein